MCGYHMKKLGDICMEFTPFHSIFPSRMKNNGNFWYIFKYCCISTTFTQFYNLNPQSYTILLPILAYFLCSLDCLVSSFFQEWAWSKAWLIILVVSTAINIRVDNK